MNIHVICQFILRFRGVVRLSGCDLERSVTHMATRRDAKALGDPAAEGFRIEHSPFFQMNRAVGVYGLAMERALRAVGMDIPRWRVLMLAHERGPISVGDIADNGVLKLSTATRVVQRLRDDDLVRLSRRKTDARVTEVSASAAGRRAVKVIRTAASDVYRRAFADVDEASIDELMLILGRVQQGLRSLL